MIYRGAKIHGLETSRVGPDLVVDYVYPGSIDVIGRDGVLLTRGRETQIVALGQCPAGPALTAELALDPTRWSWRPSTTPRAQTWVRHVFAADAGFRNQSYESEGQVVLVWHGLPVREAELSLLAAGFRPSLATWRAAATPDAREVAEALVRMDVAGPRAPTMGSSPVPMLATDDAEERAQHAWMRWFALFGSTLAAGGRTYELRGRPALRGDRLTIELRHRASPLKVHLDVGQHPLVHRVHFDADGALLEMGSLAWADLPHAVAELDDFIKGAAGSSKPAKAEAPTEGPRKDRSGSLYEEVAAAMRTLGLPPSKYTYYRRQAEKAIESGKSYQPVLRRARRKAEQLRKSTAPPDSAVPSARPSQHTPSWAERVVDAFNEGPGPRLARARQRGAVTIFVVYPEDGSEAQPIASIDVLHDEIDDVRWLDDTLPASAQDAIEDRLDHALAAAKDEAPETPARSPLEGLLELMRRRGQELGADPRAAARPGRTDEYAQMAQVLADLTEKTEVTAQSLSDWLIGRGLHRAGEMIEDFSKDEGPIEPFIAALWDELVAQLGVAEVVPHDDGFQVPADALFERGGDGRATLLVREPAARGTYLLRRVVVAVQSCEDEDSLCTVADPSERLEGGEAVWLDLEGSSSEFYRELHARIRDFEESLRRAPRALQDVRMLLYWTGVMIESPRCQGELKQAVFAALLEAKRFYDLAARRLAEGRNSDAVRRIHDALRRISAAAAELAKGCGEGREALFTPTLPTRPEDVAAFDETPQPAASASNSDEAGGVRIGLRPLRRHATPRLGREGRW